MRNLIVYLLTVFFFFSLSTLDAQVEGNSNINPALLQAELSKRGLSEAEVRAKLLSKGINMDEIRPEQLPSLRGRIEEAVAELEREKREKEAKVKQAQEVQVRDSVVKAADAEQDRAEDFVKQEARRVSKKKSDDIREEIKKGSTVDEAVSKALIEEVEDGRNEQPKSIFGQKFINELDFIKDKDFKAPDSYILNSGDKLTITVANSRVFDTKMVELDAEGNFQVSGLPRTNLRGITLGKAKQVLYGMFSRFYPISREDLNVVVSASRIVAVNIVGEVESPGTYTLSAGNSAFNALVAAKGLTAIGSVRNIQLIKTTGEKKRLDVYEFILNPSIATSFSLAEGDYISVGILGKVVGISGAVQRPFRYELNEGENLMKLIDFAGGMSENAYLAAIQVKRFVNDEEKIIDINYRDLKTRGADFPLLKGDVVVVKAIPSVYKNFAKINGAVELPGNYEITEGLTINDLVKKGVLKKEAKTDFAYLIRSNADKTSQIKIINLDEIIKNPTSPNNFKLRAEDELAIFEQERFARKDYFAVGGFVRAPTRVPYDVTKSIKIKDAINLAGGTLPQATNFAYLIRRDSLNSKNLEYLRINLQVALSQPNSPDNLTLQPNDSIYVQSKEDFMDEGFIRVSGAVRKPGEYRFARSLKLNDVITLANGFRLEAAPAKVEIFRVVLEENKPVRTIAATIPIDRDLNIAQTDFELMPYDQIVVRTAPQFSLQKFVTLSGEVNYPGEYALLSTNEKLLSVVKRAGNFGPEAFPQGATLYRRDENVGYIVVDLKKALEDTASAQNLILKQGDVIDIPKSKDIVTIQGATKAFELYPEKILQNGKVNVAFEGRRSAWYYVDKHAAGVGKNGKKRLVSVEYPNGRIKRTKDFFLFKIYPKVEKGSVVSVGYAEPKPSAQERKPKEPVNWNKVLADTIAQATSIITLIVLVSTLQRR